MNKDTRYIKTDKSFKGIQESPVLCKCIVEGEDARTCPPSRYDCDRTKAGLCPIANWDVRFLKARAALALVDKEAP